MATIVPFFKNGPGAKPDERWWGEVCFTDPQKIITLHPFTITNVTVTPAIAHLSDRPCVTFSGGSTVTHGSCFCGGVAGIRPQAGKQLRFGGTFYKTVSTGTVADNDMFAGLHVVSTTIAANFASGGTLGTDYIGLDKITGTSYLSLVSRKASSTGVNIPLAAYTLVGNAWHRYEVVITPSSTAGVGAVQVYLGLDSAAQLDCVYNGTISELPDTVSMAPAFAWRHGATTTTITSFGRFAWLGGN